jgi:Glyoxalase/Bleomycin resistance protein/Dioxygenase superfamily
VRLAEQSFMQTTRGDNSLAIVQNCWVVPDLEAAMHRWLDMGYGPFLDFEVDLPDAIYRGKKVPLKALAAMTHGGGVQIELIQQTSDGPSAYRDAFPAGGGGFHHICRIVDDYPAEIAALRKLDIALATEGTFSGIPFCYADMRASLGFFVELAPNMPLVRSIYRAVIEAAEQWDGDDPIRPLHSEVEKLHMKAGLEGGRFP